MGGVEERVVEKIARCYLRKTFGRELDDLRQQAALSVATARPGWNPSVGVSLEDYLTRCAYLSVGRYLYQTSTPVSVPINRARQAIASFRIVRTGARIPGELDPLDASLPAKHVRSVEEEFSDAEWRVKAHEYIAGVVGSLPDGTAALAVLLDGRSVTEVADHFELDERDVYKAVRRAKDALFTATSRDLVKELGR